MKLGSERVKSAFTAPRKVSEKIQTTLPSGSRTEFVVSAPVQSSSDALLSPYARNSALKPSSGWTATLAVGSNEHAVAAVADGPATRDAAAASTTTPTRSATSGPRLTPFM
jgi:hypothetical protein